MKVSVVPRKIFFAKLDYLRLAGSGQFYLLKISFCCEKSQKFLIY